MACPLVRGDNPRALQWFMKKIVQFWKDPIANVSFFVTIRFYIQYVLIWFQIHYNYFYALTSMLHLVLVIWQWGMHFYHVARQSLHISDEISHVFVSTLAITYYGTELKQLKFYSHFSISFWQNFELCNVARTALIYRNGPKYCQYVYTEDEIVHNCVSNILPDDCWWSKQFIPLNIYWSYQIIMMKRMSFICHSS